MELIDEVSPRERQREKELEKKAEVGPIGYTGLILDDNSVNRLMRTMDDIIPENWELEKKPHVTLYMGKVQPEHIKLLSWGYTIFATHVGMNDKALAVAVDVEDRFEIKNKTPHITIAYNAMGGGRPKDSKDITEWKPLRRKIMLKGNLEEVPMFIREDINESKTSAKDSLMKSKNISKEMKEKIMQYVTGGSSYKEGGFLQGLLKPDNLKSKSDKVDGVSLGADKNGFYVYTHRGRSKSCESPEKIPVKDINFIESTG